MGKTQSLFRSFYVLFRDKHVQILRVLILLCSFCSAWASTIWGRDVWAISQLSRSELPS